MPKYSGVTVSLLVDQQKLLEYDVQIDSEGVTSQPRVRCVVKGEAGQAFQIHVKVNRRQRKGGFIVDTSIDGRNMVHDALLLDPDHSEAINEGTMVRTDHMQPYRFRNITTTAGLVELQLRAYKDPAPAVCSERVEDPGEHKRDKKHHGHDDQLGEAIPASRSYEQFLVDQSMFEKHPFVIFHIEYWPEDILRTREVIPPRYSKRLRGTDATVGSDGEGFTSLKTPSRKRVKQKLRDDQPHIHPDEHMGESSAALREQQRPRGGNDPRVWNPVGRPAPHNDSREPTLDYLDPPSDPAQAAAALVAHPLPSRSVKQESQDAPAVRAPSQAYGVRLALIEAERKIRQEVIADVLAHVKQESSVQGVIAYLEQQGDPRTKRERSPLRVPQTVRGEVIDLT